MIVIPGRYDPWGYGWYYGSWYDPYGVPYRPYPRSYYDREDGAVRLKVKPRDADVYVDGYYVGRVDDFDGIFQKLPLEPGPYRIEIRKQGFQMLRFDVRVLPDRTTTFSGKLEPVDD